jgi:hypothetical protein
MSTTDLAGCESFSHGIMKQGLQVATNEYLRRSRTVLDRRMRARILSGDNPAGNGYIISVPAYNYTADECPGGVCWNIAIDDVIGNPSPAPDLTVSGDIDASWDPAAHNATPYSIAEEMNSADLRWMAQADALFLTPAFLAFQHLYEDAGVETIDNFVRFINVFVSSFVVCFVSFMSLVFMPQVKATNDDIQKKRGMLLFLPPQVIRNVKSIRQLVDEILADDVNGGARTISTSTRNGGGGLLKGGGLRDDGGAGGGGGGGGGGAGGGAGDGGLVTSDGVVLAKIRSFHGNEAIKSASNVEV